MNKVEIFYQLGKIRDAFLEVAHLPGDEKEIEMFGAAFDRINLELVREVTRDMALDDLCDKTLAECLACNKCN